MIEELDSELSSDGTVDAVIEHSYGRGYQPAVSNIGLPLDLQELCTVAGKLVSGGCSAAPDNTILHRVAASYSLVCHCSGCALTALVLIFDLDAQGACNQGSSRVVAGCRRTPGLCSAQVRLPPTCCTALTLAWLLVFCCCMCCRHLLYYFVCCSLSHPACSVRS